MGLAQGLEHMNVVDDVEPARNVGGDFTGRGALVLTSDRAPKQDLPLAHDDPDFARVDSAVAFELLVNALTQPCLTLWLIGWAFPIAGVHAAIVAKHVPYR
jgi:hypothetical protein